MSEASRNIYLALAGLLRIKSEQDVPAWFLDPGMEWAIFADAVALGSRRASPAISQAVVAISEASAGSAGSRWKALNKLAYGKDGPAIWLYESQYKDGRSPGPTTFQIKGIYEKAGLEVSSPELPDHASVELAFLAYLYERQIEEGAEEDIWRKVKKIFSKNHAGKWLPRLGRGLSASEDAAWRAVGRLLIALFERGNEVQPRREKVGLGLPVIGDSGSCSLCGFCAQICPTQALQIYEINNFTELGFQSKLCVYCNKCEEICPEEVLACAGDKISSDVQTLVQSPLAVCPACGTTTVSLAELAYTAEKLGSPAWLAYCQRCR